MKVINIVVKRKETFRNGSHRTSNGFVYYHTVYYEYDICCDTSILPSYNEYLAYQKFKKNLISNEGKDDLYDGESNVYYYDDEDTQKLCDLLNAIGDHKFACGNIETCIVKTDTCFDSRGNLYLETMIEDDASDSEELKELAYKTSLITQTIKQKQDEIRKLQEDSKKISSYGEWLRLKKKVEFEKRRIEKLLPLIVEGNLPISYILRNKSPKELSYIDIIIETKNKELCTLLLKKGLVSTIFYDYFLAIITNDTNLFIKLQNKYNCPYKFRTIYKYVLFYSFFYEEDIFLKTCLKDKGNYKLASHYTEINLLSYIWNLFSSIQNKTLDDFYSAIFNIEKKRTGFDYDTKLLLERWSKMSKADFDRLSKKFGLRYEYESFVCFFQKKYNMFVLSF